MNYMITIIIHGGGLIDADKNDNFLGRRGEGRFNISSQCFVEINKSIE